MLFSVLKYLLPSDGALCMDIGHYYTEPLANLNSCYTEARQLRKTKSQNHLSISEEILAPLVLIFTLKIAA